MWKTCHYWNFWSGPLSFRYRQLSLYLVRFSQYTPIWKGHIQTWMSKSGLDQNSDAIFKISDPDNTWFDISFGFLKPSQYCPFWVRNLDCGPKLRLDQKSDKKFGTNDPRNPYFDILFDTFLFKIPRLVSRSGPHFRRNKISSPKKKLDPPTRRSSFTPHRSDFAFRNNMGDHLFTPCIWNFHLDGPLPSLPLRDREIEFI